MLHFGLWNPPRRRSYDQAQMRQNYKRMMIFGYLMSMTSLVYMAWRLLGMSHYYHLYNRGANKAFIFREDENYLFTWSGWGCALAHW